MIDHAFKPHEVWTTRDQCEHRLDEEKDGAYGICAAPRSEHMDEVRVLKVQLTTALRERDVATARGDSCFVAMTLAQDRATEADSALAAARRALTTIEEILTDCGYTDYAARVEAIKILEALAAPAAAAGEEKSNG